MRTWKSYQELTQKKIQSMLIHLAKYGMLKLSLDQAIILSAQDN